MPRVACPECKAALKVSEASTAKKVRCPKCQETFSLPAKKPSPPASRSGKSSVPPDGSRPTPTAKARKIQSAPRPRYPARDSAYAGIRPVAPAPAPAGDARTPHR